MEEINQLLSAIMGRLDKIGADVKATKDRVEKIEQNVAELKRDVAELKQDVAELKRDVKELKNGQDRHERLLEQLALAYLDNINKIRE